MTLGQALAIAAAALVVALGPAWSELADTNAGVRVVAAAAELASRHLDVALCAWQTQAAAALN